jgi:hypothetical protein
MKIKPFSFFLIPLALVSLSTLEAGRRHNPESSPNKAAIIYFSQKEKPVEIQYDVLQPSMGLHREALLAFHHGKYEHARACFSLGLKASPRSSDLILNYSLFSMVVPWMHGQSLVRAQGLLKLIKKQKDLKDPRYILAQHLMNWLEFPDQINLPQLEVIRHPYYKKVASDLKEHVLSGADLIDPNWAKRLLPIRFAPREKRERRS